MSYLPEPLLQKSNRRFVLFPIQYPAIYEAYKTQEKAFWTAEEIDFPGDLPDWKKLNKNEQVFIENILAFFAGSDGIIMENIDSNFCQEIQIPEVRLFYGFQEAMEGIHSECYSKMIDTFINDESRKHELLNAITKIPGVKKKAEWACKFLDKKKYSIAKRLVAFAIVEGIFFAGSFCAIFWIKNVRQLMTKALTKSNELIARDESLHTDFAVLLYSYIVNKLSEDEIHELFTEAINIEIEFITDSIKCNLIGMNSSEMIKYIKFTADRLLNQLGYSKLYNEENPFPFMNSSSLDGKTNFFESRVSEYNRSEQLNGLGVTNTQILDDF